MALTAFSYSRLDNYEKCPRRFYELSILKNFKEPESDAMRKGKETHTALELRVGQGRPLPAHLQHLEAVAGPLAAAKATKLTEYQMAINASMQPVSWFGKDVYCRAIADLVLDYGDRAGLFDYKTGKKSNEFLQLKLTACMYFHHQPRVERIKCAYVWTQDRTTSPIVVERSEMGEIWATLAPRIDRYQEAFRTTDFPPRPSWQCRGCPVTTCQHWEPKR